MKLNAFRIRFERYERVYDEENNCTGQEWVLQDELISTDQKVVAATLRGLSDSIDPPRTTYN